MTPGNPPTEYQLKLLRLYVETGSTAEVAARLGISNQTVKNHFWKIRSRLGVNSTVQAIWLLRQQLEVV